MQREYPRQKATFNVRGSSEKSADSQVGCSDLLGGRMLLLKAQFFQVQVKDAIRYFQGRLELGVKAPANN